MTTEQQMDEIINNAIKEFEMTLFILKGHDAALLCHEMGSREKTVPLIVAAFCSAFKQGDKKVMELFTVLKSIVENVEDTVAIDWQTTVKSFKGKDLNS